MAGLEGMEQPRPHSGTAAADRATPPADGAAVPAPAGPVPTGPEVVGDPAVDEVRLPSRPQSARTARRLTAAILLKQWSLSPQLTEHSVLLVSELVGNAVRHTGARAFGLRILRRRGWIRVEVRDPSRGLPCLMPVQATDVSGRGLFLVDKLSDRWGVDLLPRGKTTWFEVRVGDR
ncbi:ATP-binding protein [Streptomyces sp. RS10V-4]|uniref:ATP-binding protein n=1 Tax=Streptomyces rhizoryzae TaxID=2932493 RepID=UPI0020050CB8|nr:ATP-binding protein [Streptomyces rhizoryzae]MCK7626688.1 ATP-binding protein [Streptomyces rhizoryzae]